MHVKVFCKGKQNVYEAKGVYDGKGVTVLKGSKISEKTADKVNPIVKRLRDDKKTVSKDFVTLKDISFRSPSTAATFVCGNISNGLRVWKVEKGLDLGKYKEMQNG